MDILKSATMLLAIVMVVGTAGSAVAVTESTSSDDCDGVEGVFELCGDPTPQPGNCFWFVIAGHETGHGCWK